MAPKIEVNEKFSLLVDAEHKATAFPFLSVAKPHMRSFHLCWVQFFSCFLSTFAAPPLLPIIRDNLNLTQSDIGNAGIGSVSGAIFARVVMGTACDLIGPRFASASITLLTAPAVYLSATVDSATGFFYMRFFAGFALATFVSNQYWMSSMFSPNVVGQANGQSAGWGNLGGGVAQLIMPQIYAAILEMGYINYSAWRIAFFIPAFFQTFTAFAVMFFGQDLPDGNFAQLQKSGYMHRDNAYKVLYHGVINYRSWICALAYGFCFGVELAVNNIIAYYFYDRFNLNLGIAGIVAATFGLVNIFSRPIGGGVSDIMAQKFGIRGRLWAWWVAQTISGLLCVVLGRLNTLTTSITVMIIFSIFVQAAEGLTFGVVPFVSRRIPCYIAILGGALYAPSNIFHLLVDAEHKATAFPFLSVAKPHMRSFHLCWIQFFSCFVSTFAAPPLLPIIRDNLNLTQSDIGDAGIGSVSGAIFARVVMGTACDLIGPRFASSTITLLTAPAVYLSATVGSATGFFHMRFFTGFSLATFVSSQYWMSSMFSPNVVGQANGQSAGWGNLGGGLAQLIMPQIYAAVLAMGATNYSAWRIAFFIPALFQTFTACAVMFFGQDLPDGNFAELQKDGYLYRDNAYTVLYHGVINYRSWICALAYGFCFGVELTVNNIIAYYFYDRFNLQLGIAGTVAATFGLVNIFSRPIQASSINPSFCLHLQSSSTPANPQQYHKGKHPIYARDQFSRN